MLTWPGGLGWAVGLWGMVFSLLVNHIIEISDLGDYVPFQEMSVQQPTR